MTEQPKQQLDYYFTVGFLTLFGAVVWAHMAGL